MNTKSPMLRKAIYILIPLLIIAFMVIKLRKNKEISQNTVYKYDKNESIGVEVDTIQLAFINEDNSYSGTFEPNKESKISSEIQGKVNAVLVDVGDFVAKGQSLIQLDNSLLKLQLKNIEVQIEGLQADVNRFEILAKEDAIQGVQLEKAILGLKSVRVQKETLMEQINKTTIKAPFNGVITSKLSEQGSFAAPGIPLLQLTDISTLKFSINVPENELQKFKIDKNFNVFADSYPEISFLAKLNMIGSKANVGNSFPIQFLVKNTSDLIIKSGMFGKVSLTRESNEKGIIISSSAIISSANEHQVYLVKNGKAVLQKVEISKKIMDKSIISSGLKSGDIIVKKGFINLFDGANIAVK